MCVIETALFNKQGSAEWGSCSATLSDTITVDVVILIAQSEVGKTIKVGANILCPDGIVHEWWAPSFVPNSATIYDAIVPVPTYLIGAGTYTIQSAEAWDYYANSLLCHS